MIVSRLIEAEVKCAPKISSESLPVRPPADMALPGVDPDRHITVAEVAADPQAAVAARDLHPVGVDPDQAVVEEEDNCYIKRPGSLPGLLIRTTFTGQTRKRTIFLATAFLRYFR